LTVPGASGINRGVIDDGHMYLLEMLRMIVDTEQRQHDRSEPFNLTVGTRSRLPIVTTIFE
jgi:hypothetical protein